MKAIGKLSKDFKRVLYVGFPGDKNTAFVFHGSMAFGAREVQPVSDELYEAVKNIRGFYTIETVRNSVLDFPNKGVPATPLSGADINAENDILV